MIVKEDVVRVKVERIFPDITAEIYARDSTGLLSTLYEVVLGNGLALLAKLPLMKGDLCFEDFQALGLHENESRFYYYFQRSEIKRELKVPVPRCYFEEDYVDFSDVLIMDDLSPCVLRTLEEGLDYEMTMEVVQGLVKLQNSIGMNEFDFLVNFLQDDDATINFMLAEYPKGLERFLDLFLPKIHLFDISEDIFREIVYDMQFIHNSSYSLKDILYAIRDYDYLLPYRFCHGDFHANNILFNDTLSLKGIIDFQWAMNAPSFLDVIILLFTTSTYETRKEKEREILKLYYQSIFPQNPIKFKHLTIDINLVKIFCYLQLICSLDLYNQFFNDPSNELSKRLLTTFLEIYNLLKTDTDTITTLQTNDILQIASI